MRVLLVTSWDTPCGIAEHSAMLKEAVERADRGIEVLPDAEALDPAHYSVLSMLHDPRDTHGVDIVHLNYQDGLHSRWTDGDIMDVQAAGIPVVVTYHDSGVPNSDRCKAICGVAAASVVHEPFDDLGPTTRYWRMGVADAPVRWFKPFCNGPDDRPVLGTIGFPFGWKNYPALIRAADKAGWNVLLLAPGATQAQVDEWMDCSEHIFVRAQFVPRDEAILWLSRCDASAFMYVTHNTGQSGAILLGVAARKPVYALSTCRQFRALYEDPVGRLSIRWVETFEHLTTELEEQILTGQPDKATVALAEQESWDHLGKKYAALYRSLL